MTISIFAIKRKRESLVVCLFFVWYIICNLEPTIPKSALLHTHLSKDLCHTKISKNVLKHHVLI